MPSPFTRAYWSAYLLWHYRQQPPIPYLAPSELAARRDAAVRRMVAYAYRWVPYYRRTLAGLGLTPDDFRCADDLRRLPIIGPADLQRDPFAFRSTQFGDDDLMATSSGGSTGAPHCVWHNTAALFESAAHARRDEAIVYGLVRHGGIRLLSLASPHGTGAEVHEFTHRKAFYPPRERVERLTLSLADPPEVNLHKLNAFRPDIVRSYGSYLGRLFTYIQETGAPFHRPAAIVFASDALPERARRLIQDEFGLQVFGLYQAIEGFKIGFECEAHRGYHINIDHYVLRVVNADGQDVPVGETGEVLLSNLVNRGTVLLNFRLNDMVRWLPPEPCPCGRTLPMLDYVQGRAQEWVRLPDGTLLHPQLLSATLLTLGDVQRYQAVQLAPDHFEVRLVANPGIDEAAVAERAQRLLSDKIGRGVRFSVRFVDELEITAAGKTRAVIGLGGDGLPR